MVIKWFSFTKEWWQMSNAQSRWIIWAAYAVLFLALPYVTQPIFKSVGDDGMGWILLIFYLALPLLGLGCGVADGIVNGWSLWWLLAPVVLFIPHFFLAMHAATNLSIYWDEFCLFTGIYAGFAFIPNLIAGLVRNRLQRPRAQS
ncbi:hypothetical protein HMPREF0388_0482 [Mobiluncus curtisii ATCC 51333]|uniref:Uncharacterized protein n=2 Tax=Mobiluncus curtisii TaxID=2051 RepID=E6LWT5_9ACTO|nr:hypothetical protein HMPREF0388_0482 [Mobiluncus curtisii ATCC 51333]